MCPKLPLSDLGIPPYETAEEDWVELESISDTDLFALQSLYNGSENATLSTNTEYYYEGMADLTCSETESVLSGFDLRALNENYPSSPRDYLDDIIDYDMSSDYRSETESDYVTSDEDMLSVSSGSAKANAPLTFDKASSAGSMENCMKCPEVLYVMNRSGRLYIAEDLGTLKEIISTLDDEEPDDVDYYQEDGPNNRRRQCATINVLRLDGTLRNFNDLEENNNEDQNDDCPNVLYLLCWHGYLYIASDLRVVRELIDSLDEKADYEYIGDNQSQNAIIDMEKTELNNSRRCVSVSVLRL